MANRLPDGEASCNSVYDNYIQNSKRRGLSFELTKEEAKSLFTSNCYYCGVEPSKFRQPKNRIRSGFMYNGIDRVNNEIGYTADNCVTCCFVCNRMKYILSQKEFLEHISRIAAYRIGGLNA